MLAAIFVILSFVDTALTGYLFAQYVRIRKEYIGLHETLQAVNHNLDRVIGISDE